MKSRLRVLYAEDNAQDADLTRSFFAEHAADLELDVVGTGQACLDRLSLTGCDVLLLDHRLPDMEGLDVLRTLIHAGAVVPVVLVTGSGDEDLVVKALRHGAANYVPKVGSYLETLPDLLRRVFEEHRLRRSQGLVSSEPRRVLYVEHLSMDVDLTLRHFAEAAPQFKLDVVGSCAEALIRLGRPPAYDAALVDLRMPDQSGLDFVREAKRRGLPLPPFVMISGKGDEEAAIASLVLGTADYVAKREGYLEQLPYTIERAILHHRLDHANARLQAELSERRRAQSVLEEREQELRLRNAILSIQQETTLDGMVMVDVNGQIVSSNRRFAGMWGISKAALEAGSGQRVLEWVMEQLANPEGFADKVRLTQQSPDEAGHDELVLKDGRTFDLYAAPMRANDGVRVGRVWYFRDITERVKLEGQLRASQKMEAIGSLAGGIAHDFNNLLSVILNCTEFAMERISEDNSVRDDLVEVKKAGERAKALTGQLLAFSRKQVLQPVPLNVNTVATGMEAMLRRILGEDVELTLTLATDLGLTQADPSQIEQVLMNLVVNARDAMSDGGKLDVETANVEIDEAYAALHVALMPGAYIQLTVTDTGCGMDGQTKARLFEPFFTTKERGKGTGLGLSTVYGIVKQSGGNIWVYSEPGQGTTFKVYLPRDLSATTSQDIKRSRVLKRATGTETIIVVEDEEALRKVVRRSLEAAGYTVLTARDGTAALLTCAQHVGTIDLLLTDVVMPGVSGKGLAKELLTARPRLKVLYMSGYADEAIVHHGVLDAGTHFIGKPFSAADLAQKVRDVLDGGTPDVADEHDQAMEADSAKVEIPLDTEALRVLSPDVLGALRKAVIGARYEEICALVETIRLTEPAVATGLRRMADLFDYDGLRECIGE